MSISGDVAEECARISIEGIEASVKILGDGAKEAIALICAILKEHEESSIGKTKLKTILKSGKELKIFGIEQRFLAKFTEEANRYGVTFCPLIDKANSEPLAIVDLLVKGEDAARVNRIVEKYGLQVEKDNKDKSVTTVSNEASEKVIEEKDGASQNFLTKETLSENFSAGKEDLADKKASVSKTLKEIKNDIANVPIISKNKEKDVGIIK